ncbi:MAG: LamG-like jellyroll fold domain-containing protein [Verrucomicrobiota bacterium]
MSSPSEDLDRLLAKMIDSELSAEERKDLNERLRRNPEDLEHASDFLILESLISNELRQDETGRILGHDIPLAATGHGGPEASPGKRSRSLTPLLAIAAIVLACVVAVPLLLKEHPAPVANPSDPSTAPVARMIQSFEASFGSGRPLEDGSISTGPLEILEGSIEIAFRSGPRLVIESPAQIEIMNDMTVSVLEGRIRARTPRDAAGFTITTPMARFESKGSEFGASIHTDRSTELHVFTGELQLTELSSGNKLDASEGFAREWRRSGSGKKVSEPDFQAFKSARAIANKRRHAYYRKLLQDPTILAFYDFQQDAVAPDTLVNRANPAKFDGAVDGADWIDGRFTDEGGLLFNGSEDRVTLRLPKQIDEVTMATWIRVDRFDTLFTTVLNSNGYDRNEHHWQILSDGSIRGGFNGVPDLPGERYRFNSANDIVRPGQWTHLAFTLNATSGVGRYYADGNYLGEGYFGAGIRPSFGLCHLGHWGGAYGWTTDRDLMGMMDEFLILQREMTHEEIKKLHRAGSPESW